jgi:hypothetical protein
MPIAAPIDIPTNNQMNNIFSLISTLQAPAPTMTNEPVSANVIPLSMWQVTNSSLIPSGSKMTLFAVVIRNQTPTPICNVTITQTNSNVVRITQISLIFKI